MKKYYKVVTYGAINNCLSLIKLKEIILIQYSKVKDLLDLMEEKFKSSSILERLEKTNITTVGVIYMTYGSYGKCLYVPISEAERIESLLFEREKL